MTPSQTRDVHAANRLNPFQVEIIRGAISSAIREMEITVGRTAVSSIIVEKKDYFAGLFDLSGQMIYSNIERHGPGKIDCILERFPVEEIRPGDLFWYNDPYLSHGAISHSQDMAFIAPVFHQGELVAFCATFGHFFDIGGTKPGSLSPYATEIFHEGILVPPFKIYEAGVLNEGAYNIILRNTRYPQAMQSDTAAMMAAAKTGVLRIATLFEAHGRDTVLHTFNAILDRSERAVTTFIENNIPEGEYGFEDYVDSDCVSDRPYRVKFTLRKAADQLTLDFTGTDRQAKGPINYPLHWRSATLLLGNYLRSFDSTAVLNDGAGRRFKVVMQSGTLVNPTFPAACGLRSHTMFKVINSMLATINQASSGNAPAASADYTILIYRMFENEDDDNPSVVFIDGIGAGQGGRPHADGLHVIYGANQQNFPCEYVEQEYPLSVERYHIRQDSGGAGLRPGGCGVVRDIRILASKAVIATRMNNAKFPPWGVNGGRHGKSGDVIVNPGTSSERRIGTFAENIVLSKGDVVRVLTAGGGGWGDPLRRDPEEVRRDVRNRVLSLEVAREEYGVVLTARREVDGEATRALRERMLHSEGQRPMFDRGPVQPPKP